MAATTLTLISALFLLTSAPLPAMDLHNTTLPTLPKTPSLRNPDKIAPIARDLSAFKKYVRRTKPTYAFGATAAESFEEALHLGFFKNEHPYKPNRALITTFEVGDCVIVPRSDQRLSYGVITEVLNPEMVCVACDTGKLNKNYTIKIIAASKLYLNPEWLKYIQKDTKTVAQYTRSMKHTEPLPENLHEEESYERLPALLTHNALKK